MGAIHFLYDEKTCKADVLALAEKLVGFFGQAPLETADKIVSIGGDGTLLQALRESKGVPVYGLTPPDSDSAGFLTDHAVDGPAALEEKLARAKVLPLRPLKAELTFANGRRRILYSFNDVAVSPLHGQAAVIMLSAEFAQVCKGRVAEEKESPPLRIMGDGLIFSTALGSTGTCHSYNGPVVDVRNSVMILTGKGLSAPRGGISPFVVHGHESFFRMSFVSAEAKRPVRIDYDGHDVSVDTDGSPVTGLKVSLARGKTVRLLVAHNPAKRSFRAI